LDTTHPILAPSFLSGGGEMGALTRAYNWTSSPVGPPDDWPPSLRITVSNLLRSRFPMFLWWGRSMTQFYNDAYRPSLGNIGKHPLALGQDGADCWPEIWPIISPLIDSVRATGEPTWMEDQLVPIYRNGAIEDVYWTYSYSAVLAENGSIGGILVTCVETTEAVLGRKEREQSDGLLQSRVIERTAELEDAHRSLLRHHDYLQSLIDRIETAVCTLVPIFEGNTITDFRFHMSNHAYSRYSGRRPEEITGETVISIFPEYKQTDAFEKYAETWTTGLTNQWELHYNVDGLDVHLGITASRMGAEVVVNLTDFTTVKNLQLELMAKIAELERSNAYLEEFAHAASHDLKEPIRKIHTFSERLKVKLAPLMDARDFEMFGRLESASHRMDSLIEDLLTYSQVSLTPPEKEMVDLNAKVAAVLTDLEVVIEETEAGIEVEQLPVVPGYPRQLQQLFQNILSNALKYRRPGVPPRISVKAATVSGAELETLLPGADRHATWRLIEIQDNGIGFEQQHADRIFRMFERLHARAEYGGTGVGLSIVQKVAQNHGGIVRANSVPGAGTRFSVIVRG
jgi:signal transduction histidine kinase